MIGLFKKQNRWKGFLLGSLGGIAGVLAMRYYWKGVMAWTGEDPRKQQAKHQEHPLDDISIIGTVHKEGESSTEAIGRVLYTWITGQEPQSQETKTTLSYIVHWVISMLAGGFYGALRKNQAVPDLTGGAALGTGLWFLGDELMMPLLGLTDGPTRYPLELHIHSWNAHFVYGLASSTATQILFKLVK